MKILDRYILTSFLTTFATVFVILFFIFILQAVWLFIAELAGKDLGVMEIVNFLVLFSPKTVPMVLPLSILLAAIMTFGSFAENYEFAAMKSSGISLGRAMKWLTVFITILGIVAFFFANNVIPKAEYKFINLRKNIIQRKPAMAIVEGQFNSIGNFNIKVDNKSGENGEILNGVTIHKRDPGAPNATIIRSKTGLLKSSESSNLLQLELYDGYYYEEVRTKNIKEKQKHPFAKSTFSKQIMNIDLTVLNKNENSGGEIANTNTMLNINELRYTLDSLEGGYKQEKENFANNMLERTSSFLARKPIAITQPVDTTSMVKKDSLPADLLSLLDNTDKKRVLDIAVNNVGSSDFMLTNARNMMQERIKGINNHWLALYDKFVIAYACLLMFFIGAPLGAIIRKGGLGLPIVCAVIIFIVFHFANTFGKKLAQENGITPFFGSWMSSFILTPLAVFLTYRATNDIGLMINFDWIVSPFQRLFAGKTSNDETETDPN